MIPIPIIGDLIDGIIGIAKQAIPDPNKQAELQAKLDELRTQVELAIVQTHTVPWVDAAVKLLYALNDIIKQGWRPAVSAGLFIYGVLHPDQLDALHKLGTSGDAGIAALFGAFPGWMWSRHTQLSKGESK